MLGSQNETATEIRVHSEFRNISSVRGGSRVTDTHQTTGRGTCLELSDKKGQHLDELDASTENVQRFRQNEHMPIESSTQQ